MDTFENIDDALDAAIHRAEAVALVGPQEDTYVYQTGDGLWHLTDIDYFEDHVMDSDVNYEYVASADGVVWDTERHEELVSR